MTEKELDKMNNEETNAMLKEIDENIPILIYLLLNQSIIKMEN